MHSAAGLGVMRELPSLCTALSVAEVWWVNYDGIHFRVVALFCMDVEKKKKERSFSRGGRPRRERILCVEEHTKRVARDRYSPRCSP